MKILVVDDEEEICKMLSKYLSIGGHRVKYVLMGKKAVDQVEKEYFDVVFLDIFLPGLSGIEVLDKIKIISPDTKVIMMTGKIVNNDLRKEVSEKGASRCLQKPFKMEEIEKILNGFNKYNN